MKPAAACACLLLSAFLAPAGAAQTPPPVVDYLHVPAVDTLHFTTRSGSTLFFTLPDSVGNRPVRTYRARSLPALSWLVDRAFFWRTTTGDGGRYALRFEAAFDDTPPEALLAIIEVRPGSN